MKALGFGYRPARLCLTVVAVMTCCSLDILAAQSSEADSLVIDHSNRTARLNGIGEPIENGGSIRLDSGRGLLIVVKNTNSALYAHSASLSETPVDLLAAVRIWTGNLAPYITDLLRATVVPFLGHMLAAGMEVESSIPGASLAALSESEFLRDVEEALQELDSLRAGYRDARLPALLALERMRTEPDIAPVVADFRSRRDPTSCCNPEAVATILVELQGMLDSLRTVIRTRNDERLSLMSREVPGDLLASDSVQTLLEVVDPAPEDTLLARLRRALADAPTTIAEVRGVRELVESVLGASDRVEVKNVRADAMAQLTLEVSVTPKKDPELGALGDLNPLQFELTILGEPLVLPVVSVAAMVVPGAVRDSMGLVGPPGSRTLATFEGEQDRRVQWNLGLGLKWRDFGGGFSWVLPELIVNPSKNVLSFGAGGALMLRFVKIGGGVLWTKYTEPVNTDITASGALRPDGTLQTESKWGFSPYLSAALVGIPPFVAK